MSRSLQITRMSTAIGMIAQFPLGSVSSRAMLCARSEFFAAMKDGTDGLVDIDDGNLPLFWVMSHLVENKLIDIPIIKKMSSSAILLQIMEYIYTDNINEQFNRYIQW